MPLAAFSPSLVAALPSPALADVLMRGDIWRGDRLAHAETTLPTGYPGLDAVLPGGGWPCGSLVDVLHPRAGIGELALLLPALSRLTCRDEWVALQAPPRQVFAPAWQASGVCLSRLIVFKPESRKTPVDQLWAAEQILRAGSISMALLWLPKMTTAAHLRRLQVAAEAGGTIGFFLQDESRLGHPSAAPLRLRLEAHANGLIVDVVKRRGAPLGQPLLLPLHPPVHRMSRRASSASGFPPHALARPRFPLAAA